MVALPEDVCDLVYASPGYEQSLENLGPTTLDTDMVFSDGYASQLAKASGGLDEGIALSLNVGV